MFEKTEIIGHIGQDAKVNQVGNQYVTNFTVAIGKKFKNRDGVTIESTRWYNVSYWTQQISELAKYLVKGKLVRVEGEPVARMYTTGQGQQAIAYELRTTARDILLMGGGKQETQAQATASAAPKAKPVQIEHQRTKPASAGEQPRGVDFTQHMPQVATDTPAGFEQPDPSILSDQPDVNDAWIPGADGYTNHVTGEFKPYNTPEESGITDDAPTLPPLENEDGPY